jgi:flagellum-specific ATP synthase
LYQQNKDLITIGAYQRGSDARLDEAVTVWPKMVKFLQQAYDESEGFDSSLDQLNVLLED